MKRCPIAAACGLAICLGGLFPRAAHAIFETGNNHRVKVSGSRVNRTVLPPNQQSVLYLTIKRTVEHGGTSIASVARLAGLQYSSAQLAMRTLIEHGYVRPHNRRGYRAQFDSALQLWASVARRGLSTGPMAQGSETIHSIHAATRAMTRRHPVDPKAIDPRDLETPEAYTVMMKLYRQPADVASIAEYAGLEPGNAYAIVARLLKKEYVAARYVKNPRTRRQQKEHFLEQDGEQDLARGLWLGGFLPHLYVVGLVSQALFENGPIVSATHQHVANHDGGRLTPYGLTTLWCILYGDMHTTGAIGEVTGRRTSAVASTLHSLPSNAVKIVDLSTRGVSLSYRPDSGAKALHRRWHAQGGLIAGLGDRAPQLFAKARELAPDDPSELLSEDHALLGTSRASIHLAMAAGFHGLPQLSEVLGLPANNIHVHLKRSIKAGLAHREGDPGTPDVRFDNTDTGVQTLRSALARGGYLPSVVRDGLVTPARPWDQ